jgi:RNA polymerase sigma-70 factor (ECF subfamily)
MTAQPNRAPQPSSTLVARIARGDPDAEREFVERFRRGVQVLVRRHCRPNDPVVDDLAQEVLVDVLQRLREGALRDGDALPGYLRNAAVFAAQAEYRRRARRGETGIAVDPDSLDARNGGGDVDPALGAQREQLARQVRQLLAETGTPRDREILRRFYLQEQERDEICAALGIEPDHFRRVLFRARERFATLARQQELECVP